jgi:hypothetical protein
VVRKDREIGKIFWLRQFLSRIGVGFLAGNGFEKRKILKEKFQINSIVNKINNN